MSGRQPTISAFVIVYNGMKFLPECLQTLTEDLCEQDHEVILVDNGSGDGSVEFIKENYPDAKLIENGTNLGFARAVNIGLQASRGEYLYVLNQDLRFKKGATKALLERLKSEPDVGMIAPKLMYFDGPVQRFNRAFPTYKHVIYHALLLDRLFPHHREFSHWRMGWFDHLTDMYVDQPMGAVMMIPKKVVDEIGLMDESFPLLFNDVDYCKRIAEAGYKRLYYTGAVVEHYVGASTSTIPYKLKWISHSSMYRYLGKYAKWYEYPLLWFCGLLLLVGLVPSVVIRFVRRLFK